jgi:hypothetical protein
VALLIDNHSDTPTDTREAMAITVLGQAMEAPPEERERFLRLFLNRHPNLNDFATSATCALMAVRISTYIIVQRFGKVQEIRMD